MTKSNEQFKLDFDEAAFKAMGVDVAANKEEKELEEEVQSVKVSTRMAQRHYERRVKSELALEQQLPWHFEKGCSYHCISHGDVDSLTYLRAIIKQQKVRYCILSTWCMAITDVEEIET